MLHVAEELSGAEGTDRRGKRNPDEFGVLIFEEIYP